MKNWLPLLMLVVGACTQAGTPTSLPTSPVIGLELVTPNAAQLNSSLLTKSANATPQTLRIHHRSLGKSFLYIAAITETSSPASKFQPFRPRIVQFQKAGATIVLSDIRPHQRYTQRQTLPRIISQFPIVNEDADGIEFDFATGMKSTFMLEADATTDTESILLTGTPLHSYIQKSISTPSMLALDHHFTQPDNTHTIVIRHIFRTESTSTLPPKEMDVDGQFGYFTTPPWYEYNSKEPHHTITRWALQRPITVALSPNIPSALRPVFKEAVLSWNQTVGHDIFALSSDAADRGPLDFRYDVDIIWVDHDDHGLARGITYAHPVTGEILHGDVMFQSGWYTNTKEKLGSITVKPNPPSGFESAELCRYTLNSDRDEEYNDAMSSADLQIALTHNTIRHVLIHELGHILGLRHNFAGSIEPALNAEQFKKLWNETLQGKPDTDHPMPSSSIMDYLAFPDDVLMPHPGPYDVAAIQWAYFPDELASQSSFRFCTDEDMAKIADCQQRDANRDPLNFVSFQLQGGINTYIRHAIRDAFVPVKELEKHAVIHGPSTEFIKNWLARLHNYLTGTMTVWALNGQTPYERMENAHRILENLPTLVRSQKLLAAFDTLENKIKYGDTETQQLAKNQRYRLMVAIKKLQMLLDAPVGSLNKKPDGTTADSDYGD